MREILAAILAAVKTQVYNLQKNLNVTRACVARVCACLISACVPALSQTGKTLRLHSHACMRARPSVHPLARGAAPEHPEHPGSAPQPLVMRPAVTHSLEAAIHFTSKVMKSSRATLLYAVGSFSRDSSRHELWFCRAGLVVFCLVSNHRLCFECVDTLTTEQLGHILHCSRQ